MCAVSDDHVYSVVMIALLQVHKVISLAESHLQPADIQAINYVKGVIDLINRDFWGSCKIILCLLST